MPGYRHRRNRHEGGGRRPRHRCVDRPVGIGSTRRNRRRPMRWRWSSASSSTHFEWTGPVGCGFPAVVRNGVVGSAANIDESWIDVDADALFSNRTGALRPHDQRCRRSRCRRDALRRRARARRCRDDADVRHRHRIRACSSTGCSSRTPNSATSRLDGHDAESRAAASAREPERVELVAVGGAGPELSAPRRAAVLARPVHRRRRSEQAVRKVAAAHRHRDRDRAGADGQQRRNRRRRVMPAPCGPRRIRPDADADRRAQTR